jgi:succinate-semialdehyde dehydrogenase/glutarate-semialdehyde dehydrogenase
MKVINPANNKLIRDYPVQPSNEVKKRIHQSHEAFLIWSKLSFEKRAESMKRLGAILRAKIDICALLMTEEMGKPIEQSKSEVLKCASACDYYAANAAELLKSESKIVDGKKSVISFEPIGVILGIMPWNYPLWQVFRFGMPTLMAGNGIVLKHAPNVTGCSLLIESLVKEAGFPEHLLTTILVETDSVPDVISNDLIKGIALTGSERAGVSVGANAGKALKKCVLELGGSDPFIVLEDAEIDTCVTVAVNARLQNCGQSCIAAKRFIVVEPLYDRFCQEIKKQIEKYKVGDPLDTSTEMGPLAREDLLKNLERQVDESINKGAKLVHGGKRLDRKGCFYQPTLLTNVQKGMPVYHEETFGPVFAIISVKGTEEAIKVANDSSFGLGASIWTRNSKLAEEVAAKIEAGMVCVNDKTVSNIQLPFGGSKRSGHGRELSSYGIKEFVNIKTVVYA